MKRIRKRKTRQPERLFQAVPEMRVHQLAGGGRSITGYAAVFNQPSVDLGNFIEIVAPGCFDETLRKNRDILCLRDHNPIFLMGRTKARTLMLSVDTTGLRFVCDLPNTSQADDLVESIGRGDLDGVSFGFKVRQDDWTTNDKGQLVRTLIKVDLIEVSPCSFPAYPAASVSLRSCPPALRMRANLLLEQRSVDDDEEDEDGCDCDCSNCEDGDCENCTDPDFDHDRKTSRSKCVVNDTEVRRMAMRLALAQRR